jgi:AraC family transcriptional regulator
MGANLIRLYRESQLSLAHSVTTNAIPRHSHPEYVLGYYFRGRSPCRFSSCRDLEFGPGDLGLLNPGSAHEDYASRQERDYLTVNLKKSFFEELFRDLGCSAQSAPHFPCPKITGNPDVRRICQAIRTEIDADQFGRGVVLRSLVTELAVCILRQLDNFRLEDALSSMDERACQRQVRRVAEYLQENYAQEFDLDRIAAVAGLSKYHLERAFKRATGLTLHTYMVMLRLERAKHSLGSTAKSIVEIALELGFSDQSHFTNVFRRFVGVTPHAYRLSV